MNEEIIEANLYIIDTEKLEPSPSAEIKRITYRILATSLKEAIEIVEESFYERTDEIVTSACLGSHITGMRKNRYRVVMNMVDEY